MPRYFDNAIPNVGSAELKPMVKAWGGDPKMRKEECINYLRATLKDPGKMQSVVASLTVWERNALAIIKNVGGVIGYKALQISIRASGLHPSQAEPDRDDFITTLLRHGLILSTYEHRPDSLSDGSSYGRESALCSDDRILVHIGYPEYVPFKIKPMPNAPQETHFRRPPSVVLDIVGMLQTITNLGALKLTKNGEMRVPEETRFRKAMRWSEKGLDLDGFLFPEPEKVWLSAFWYANFLKHDQIENTLTLQESPETFAQRPYSEQALLLINGLTRCNTWWESPPKSTFYYDEYGLARHRGRLALIIALASLPTDSNAFFSFKDFEYALYDRIGETFALKGTPERPYFLRSINLEKKKLELIDWQEKVRKNWLFQEAPWFLSIFTTWLYFLGLVELATENGQVTGFRLTDLGRETLHPELAAAKEEDTSPSASNQPAWVVQPNFDIIAYLDRVSAPQLAFLERHAERTQSQRHTAHYRLTRESVYRGLESGSTLDDLLEKLQAGSQAELSQNVIVELREWASMRERITLRRNARLMEFPSPQALQSRLAHGPKGTIVAERFLLLDSRSAPPVSGLTSIDYAKPLPKNLTVTETGQIHLKRASHDLMIAAQLSQWALPLADDEWQLTAESVSNALRSGQKPGELQILLKNRMSHTLPPLLEIALRSWGGETFSAELESVIVLRCPQEQVFKAIITSPQIRPLLKGYLAPGLLCVDSEHLDALRQQLDWLGLKVSSHLKIVPPENVSWGSS